MQTRRKIVVTVDVPGAGMRTTDDYEDAIWVIGSEGTLIIRKAGKGVHTIAEYAAERWISVRRYDAAPAPEVWPKGDPA